MYPRHLLVIRHAESVRNLASRRARLGDSSLRNFVVTHPSHLAQLTDEGVHQAVVTGEWLRSLNLGKASYDTSDAVRAKETARWFVLGATWQIDTRLRERNLGVIESMTTLQKEEFFSQFSEGVRILDKYDYKPPGGESLEENDIRWGSYLYDLRLKKEKVVMAMCHGRGMRILDAKIHRLSPREFEFIHGEHVEKIPNAAVIHYTRENPETGEVIPEFGWVRMCTPWKNPEPTAWIPIERNLFASEPEILARTNP